MEFCVAVNDEQVWRHVMIASAERPTLLSAVIGAYEYIDVVQLVEYIRDDMQLTPAMRDSLQSALNEVKVYA